MIVMASLYASKANAMMILMLAPTYAKEEAAALLLHHLQAIALSQDNVHVKNHPSQLNINAHLQ
jgi:hypothetical protein